MAGSEKGVGSEGGVLVPEDAHGLPVGWQAVWPEAVTLKGRNISGSH